MPPALSDFSSSESGGAAYVLDLDLLLPADQKWIYEAGPQIHADLISMLEEVGKPFGDNIIWWFSSVASRDVYVSPLYERCCRIALVQHYAKDESRLLRVVSSDKPLSRCIGKWSNQTGKRHVRVEHRRNTIKSSASLFLRWWLSVLTILRELVERIVSRNQSSFRERAPAAKILIDTFVLGRQKEVFFSKNDHYYPRLDSFVAESERSLIGVLPTSLTSKNFRDINQSCRESDDRCLIMDDALYMADYLWVGLVVPIKLLFLSVRLNGSYRSMSVSGCLRSEVAGCLFHRSILLAHLVYRFCRRAKSLGLEPHRIIDWSENQVVDKAFCRGVSDTWPSATLYAYKAYPVSVHYLPHLMTTKQERMARVVPELVGTVGEVFLESVLEHDPGLEVQLAPAFRFQRNLSRLSGLAERPENQYIVLVVLPIPPNEIICIFERLSLAWGRLREVNCASRSVQFWIKQHPKGGSLPKNWRGFLPNAEVSVKKESISCLSSQADVMVSNTSSACLEGLIEGIRVAVIPNPSGLVFNPIPDTLVPSCWRVCFDAQALCQFLLEVGEPIPDLSELFVPVNKSSVKHFLG